MNSTLLIHHSWWLVALWAVYTVAWGFSLRKPSLFTSRVAIVIAIAGCLEALRNCIPA